MKLRKGFVSNSSSTGFLIACDNLENEARITLNFNKLKYNCVITNLKELEEYIKDTLSMNNVEISLEDLLDLDSDPKVKRMHEFILQGKKVISGIIDSDIILAINDVGEYQDNVIFLKEYEYEDT